MNIILSFIGKLPNYMIDCIHQIRSFSTSSIYIIINDYESQYLSEISKYNVNIINYDDVINTSFLNTVNENLNKFCIIPDLGDRSHLFIRAFERFFLLHNLMKNKELENCFFMEVDNLIYDDPNNWVEQFSKSELCYMFDSVDRCSSGIMYVKHSSSLDHLLENYIEYIKNSNEFMNEMTCLYRYYEGHKNEIQLLPIYWKNDTSNELTYNNIELYNDSIFDAAAIGIFLLGEDPYHNNGQIVLGKKNPASEIDYTNEKFDWKKDEKGRNKPYIWNGEKWLLINNLHVHSKELHSGLSLPL
jgi:hypothetical protein